MRKLTFLFLLCLSGSVFSQQFMEAPKLDRPVKKITEWQTFPAADGEPEETRKGGVYAFRRDGKLTRFEGNDFKGRNYAYQYDGQGRLTQAIMNEKLGGSIITYTYGDGFKKAEIKGDSIYLVTTHFMDEKGKVVEEKTSGKAWFTGGKFGLISRKVLNYNGLDSLFGEMEYLYVGGQEDAKLKTVHHYDPAANRKTRSVFFDKNGNEERAIEYIYAEDGRLATVETKWPEKGESTKKEYKYKDGKLWMLIEHRPAEEERLEKIFKDGRLVRSKYFLFDELIRYTDFQYDFY